MIDPNIIEYVDFEEIPNPDPPKPTEDNEIIEVEVEEVPEWETYLRLRGQIRPRSGSFEQGTNRFDNITDISDYGIFGRKKRKPRF